MTAPPDAGKGLVGTASDDIGQLLAPWQQPLASVGAPRHSQVEISIGPSHLTPRYRRILGFFPRSEYPSDHAHLTLPISTDPWILTRVFATVMMWDVGTRKLR